MLPEQLTRDIAAFQEQASSLRSLFDRALETGSISSNLQEKIAVLKKEEQRLLITALPFVRRKLLQSRDPEALLTNLTSGSDPRSISEADISPEEKELCRYLIRQDPPDMPEIPDTTTSFPLAPEHRSTQETSDEAPDAIENGSAADENLPIRDADPDISIYNETLYNGSPYLTVRNDQTCFLFLEDGEVILFENNNGWQCRRKPILENCFAENAVMESDHSCLVLNLDHGIDRISYARIETADDLYNLPLFTEPERTNR